MQHYEALKLRIRESRCLAGQLLQTALREALAPLAGAGAAKPKPAAAPVAPGRQMAFPGLLPG